MREHPRLLQRLLFSAVFTAVIAIPSTVALSDMWSSGMNGMMLLLGSLCFAVLLTLLFGTPAAVNHWRVGAFRKTFWVLFSLRLLVSVVVPLGLILDAIPGFIAIIFGSLFDPSFGIDKGGNEPGLITIFLLPLTQGTLLTILFLIAVSIAYAFVPEIKKQPPKGLCASCGYDLRASVGVCPECGASIPEAKPEVVPQKVMDMV